jgi:Zn-dependent metalloprotease
MTTLTRLTLLATLALASGILAAWGNAGPVGSQDDEPAIRARGHLRSNPVRLGLRPDLHDLKLVGVREGLSSQHVRYQQTLAGLPVFGRFLTVSLPTDRRSDVPPYVVSRYGPATTGHRTPPPMLASDALAVVQDSVSVSSDNLRGPISTALVYYPMKEATGTEHVLAWQITAPTLQPLGSWLFVLRADNGDILLRQNLIRFDSGQAFEPNPAKSSGGLIPPPVDCDSPSNESSLSSQYAGLTLRGIDAGQDRLIGEFVDLSAPGVAGAYKPAAIADEPSRNYVYGCNDDRFEEVMVYHHIDSLQRKIQSLGFSGPSGIIDRPIPAHAHYFSDCNAFYDPTDLGIHFGDGDICSSSADAAEDADVIVHEYGHAIQQDQVPGWGFGPLADTEQAWAMGEGFGDFLTAAVFGDPCLGEWFNLGVNACSGSPALRSLENSTSYNGSVVVGLPSWCPISSDPHCAGLVWAGALWDLVQAFGGDHAARDTVLTLVLDSHFYLDPWSAFTEAAAAIRQSDILLHGGANVTTIDSAFSARGISTAGAISDFPYAYLRIIHSDRGDLDVQLQVGLDVNNPVCTVNVWDPQPGPPAADLVGFLDLTGDPCAIHLPPSPSTPWHLEVGDAAPTDAGVIEQFEIVLSGTSRCVASDVPVAVPDNNGFVYSNVDCSAIVSSPGESDTDGDTILDTTDTDDDNDGFSDTVELAVGTDHLIPCAETPTADDEADDKWPPDLNDDQTVNIVDIVQLTPPTFGSQSSDPAYSARIDFNPDGVINILDIAQMTPPVFGSSCP